MLITLDTNQLDEEKIRKIYEYSSMLGFDVKTVSVTDREIEGSDIEPISNKNTIQETGVYNESQWGSFVWGSEPINESFVLGESKLGSSVLSGTASHGLFEVLLKIISNGSFPVAGKRDSLTKGERRLLRDTLIFEAHVRNNRNIFVSDDKKAYIGKTGNLRELLEKIGKTKIMTFSEFVAYCENRIID